MKRKEVLFAVVILALATAMSLLTLPAFAQSVTTGDIAGTVQDPSGAVVPNATVMLKNDATGVTITTKSNNSGVYRFTLLQPGRYTVSVSQQGFGTTNQAVQVGVGQVTSANLQLQVGQTSQTVEVTAAAPLLQTETGNISTTFNTQQIENVPNPGNDLTFVAQTAPGVTINSSSGGGYGNFTAFGLPATSNLFTVNGNDEMDPYLNLNNSGATNLMLGANEVQEVAVVSNGYTGQYGRQAGAQVDYVTKSGTNDLHGNLKYWWNGRYLNANDWFANHSGAPRPFENNNQYAAALGGPIKKDKAFFFVGTEGLRYILGTSNQIFVPTPTFQSAVLANLAASGAGNETPFYQQIFNIMNGAPGLNHAVPVTDATDPSGNLGCGDVSGTTLGGIPFGAGGLPCAVTFRSTVGAPSSEWLMYSRVDVNAGNNDKLGFRFKTDHGIQATYTDPFNSLFNATSNQPQYEGQLTETHIFSPNVVNNFIASGNWYSAMFVEPHAAQARALMPFAIQDLDSPFGNNTLDLVMVGGEAWVFPQGRRVTQYQFVDDLSVTKGNHALKFGTNFRRNDISDAIFGTYTHPRLRIFSTTDFASGIIDQIRERFPQKLEQPVAIWSAGVYGQDEWRVTPKLKLTLSLRVDRNSNAVCQTNCFSRLATTFQNLPHDPAIPYDQMIRTGLHRTFPALQAVAWQPRFGFAYSIGPSTVLRGGIGIFSDLYSADLVDNFARNSPGVNQFTLAGLPLAPNVPGSATSTIAGCDAAFNSAFFTGGTVSTFQATAPTGCKTPDYNSVAKKVFNPTYQEWNFELQQGFGRNTSVSLNYVGNHGYHEFLYNQLVNAFNNPATGVSAPELPNAPPDLRVANVQNLYNGAVSNYNGFTASISQRAMAGLSFQANYTWSHAIDEVSNGGINPFSLNDSLLGQINPFNLRQNYGSADYDVRHNFTASYVWQVPFKFGNTALNEALGGWTISGTFFAHSAYPYTVQDFGALFGNGATANIAGASPLPSFLGGTVPNCNDPNKPCLSLTQFTPSGTEIGFGNQRRNAFRGPHYFNSDFTLRKDFRVKERVNFGIGATAYNVFNHPNFGNPIHDVSSTSTFGLIQNTVVPPTSPYGAFVGSAVSGRILQLTGQISF
jgi:Carboxypeptidase regulatory-like domain/TonB-dependent Receptor Plug Domain/TonB dependent receptor